MTERELPLHGTTLWLHDPEILQLQRKMIKLALRSLIAVLILLAVPDKAEAKAKTCDPNGNCYYTGAWTCSDLRSPPSSIPAGWTCTDMKPVGRPGRTDLISRDAKGRATLNLNGQRVIILSDALEAQFAGKRPDGKAFERLVRSDVGTVSEARIRQISKELGVPFEKPSGTKE